MPRCLVVTALVQLLLPSAFGWGAHGHRLITDLAFDGLPPEAPGWLRAPETRRQAGYQSNLPDRWRGLDSATIGHENKPDHYLDAELLEQFGLTLETVPPLRYEYLRAMAVSKHVHPEKVDAYDAAKDEERTKEWPGFVLHAIAEHYSKLRWAFCEVRILEELKDPDRAEQLVTARATAVYHIGMLSHAVGDVAQPLHTTRHFNGWDGENPNHYTTERTFHSYIDTGILKTHEITLESLKALVRYDVTLDRRDPWEAVLKYFRQSFERVEPLYRLQRDGQLDQTAGKELICGQLCDGGAMLSALIWSAYTSAAPTPKQIADFAQYDDSDAGGTPPTRASSQSTAAGGQP